MSLSSISLSFFRSYEQAEAEFGPRGALLTGDNGVGKSNILEAIYLAHTGRSQRGASRAEMVQAGHATSSVRARTVHETQTSANDVDVCLSRKARTTISLNGKRLISFVEWFKNANIVSFGPEDTELIQGSPSERRRYVDMLLGQTDPCYLANLIGYRRALMQRNALLVANASDDEFAAHEEQMAEYGSRISSARWHIVPHIFAGIPEIYASISPASEVCEVRFAPSIMPLGTTQEEWKNVFYNTLIEKRKRDISLGFSSSGPHRDDFRIILDGKQAKAAASQGQIRSAALALRLSAMDHLFRTKGAFPVVLVDDALGGLDRTRSERIFPLFSGRGQLFVTSHDTDIPLADCLPVFRISRGRIAEQ